MIKNEPILQLENTALKTMGLGKGLLERETETPQSPQGQMDYLSQCGRGQG